MPGRLARQRLAAGSDWVCGAQQSRQAVSDIRSLAEQRLETVMRLMRGWVWETDVNHLFTYMTESVTEFAGHPPEWHYGKTRKELGNTNASAEEQFELIRNVSARNAFGPVLYQRRQNNSIIWMRTSGWPLFNSSGEFTGYRGVASDVTAEIEERNRKEELESEVIRSHELLKTTIDHFPVAVSVFDAEHRLAAANRLYYDAFDLPANLFGKGVRFADIVEYLAARGEFSADGLEELSILQCSTSPPGLFQTFERTRPNGRVLRARGAKLMGGGFVRTYTDVTERTERLKLLEDTARELRDRMETTADSATQADQMSRAMADFLATMSHEIRTPMSGVMGMLGLLRDTGLTDQQNRLVDTASASGDVLLAVVDDILDYSKLQAGAMRFECVDFQIEEVIESVVFILSSRAQNKGIWIDTSFAPLLPRWVRGDPTRLKQVLFNLIGNAIKFTEHGGVDVRCAIEAQDLDCVTLSIEVADTGIGISENQIENIFSRFSQADLSISRKYGGSGLGLSICSQLIRLMGGDIKCQSALGKGSTFQFTARLGISCDSFNSIGASVRDPLPASHAKTILVVDDDEVNQKLLEIILTRSGHSVDRAGNGLAAVDAASRKPYDAILMDMRMPILNGPEATARIRGSCGPNQHVPIIGLTANVLPEHRAQCIESGMNEVLCKPVDVRRLQLVLSSLKASAVAAG